MFTVLLFGAKIFRSLVSYLSLQEKGGRLKTMHIDNNIQDMDITALVGQVAKLTAIMEQQTQPQITKGDTITLDCLMSEWIQSKIDITESTRQRYESLYRNHIQLVFGGSLLSQIDRPMIQRFANRELGLCSEADTTANRYTLETVKAVIQNVLKPMMLYAVDNGYILKNPCLRINLPKRNYLNHKKACSFNTLLKLWDYAKSHRLGFTVLVLATTGMRREELLGLMWKYVDLKKGLLFVCRAYTKTCITGECILKEPKTRGSIRHIPLTDTVIKLLQEHRKRQPKGYKFVVSIEGADKPMNPDNYSHMLKRWVKGAGIRQKLTAHIFRHYAVMCLRRMGYGLEDIAQFTGHTNLSTLRDYYTDFDDIKSPVVKRMVKDMNLLAIKTMRHTSKDDKKWTKKSQKKNKEKDRQIKENRHFQ